MRSCQNKGGVFVRVILNGDAAIIRQMLFKPFAVMPLGGRCSDAKHPFFFDTRQRHFGNDPALVIGKIAKTHAPDFWHGTGNQAFKPFHRLFTANGKSRKAGQIQNAGRIVNRLALFANPLLPWAVTLPGMGGLLGSVIAFLGKPVGPLPAIIGTKNSAAGFQVFMDWRKFLVSCRRPFMVRKMHGIFIAIDFHAFLVAIVLIAIIGEAARIA